MSADVHIADMHNAVCAQHLIRHLYSKDQDLSSLHRKVAMMTESIGEHEGFSCFSVVWTATVITRPSIEKQQDKLKKYKIFLQLLGLMLR